MRSLIPYIEKYVQKNFKQWFWPIVLKSHPSDFVELIRKLVHMCKRVHERHWPPRERLVVGSPGSSDVFSMTHALHSYAGDLVRIVWEMSVIVTSRSIPVFSARRSSDSCIARKNVYLCTSTCRTTGTCTFDEIDNYEIRTGRVCLCVPVGPSSFVTRVHFINALHNGCDWAAGDVASPIFCRATGSRVSILNPPVFMGKSR